MAMTDAIGSNLQSSYIAQGLFRQTLVIEMMAAAFKEADKQRADLLRNGPWTARTDSIARFSRFETFA